MQALNSAGYTRKTLAVTGMGMFIAFLFLVPLTAFATTGVTVTTDSSTYSAGATIKVSGTVTPAPGLSGTYVAVSILTPTGATADANEFAVNSATGAYNGTFVGGLTYTPNGTYTIKAVYNGVTASATFTYGSTTTVSPTASGTTTTIITTIFSTQITTVSQAFTTTIVSSLPGTTVTSVVTSVTSTVINNTTSAPDSTGIAIGALGLIIAIVAIILVVLLMRKK